jgi:phosphoglycolate phosphatase
MIKGIIFDKDGTLFDFNATLGAWTRGMLEDEAGGDPATLIRLADVLGYDLSQGRFRPGSVVIAEMGDRVADAILTVIPGPRAALLGRMRVHAAEVAQIEAVPLASFMTGLKNSGLILGLATNDNESSARQHLMRASCLHVFDFVAGYDSGHGAKPGPGQLLAFCEAMELAPADCAMIGDSTHDLDAGRAAGMTCIGVLTGPAPAEELSPVADVVLASIGGVPDWLDAQRPTG